MNKKENRLILLGAFGGLLVSYNIVANRYLVSEYGSHLQLLLTGTRMVVLGIVMLFICNVKGSNSKFTKSNIASILKYSIIYAFIVHVLGYTINSIALSGITAGTAGVAEQTRVLFNIVIGYFVFGKTVGRKDYPKVTVYAIGVFIILISNGVEGNILYIVLEFVSISLFALGDHVLKNNSVKLGLSTRSILSLGMLLGGILLILNNTVALHKIDSTAVMIVAGSILVTLGNILISTKVLDNLTPYKANLSATSSALGAIVLGLLFTNDKVEPLTLLALVIIFSANIANTLSSKIKQKLRGR